MNQAQLMAQMRKMQQEMERVQDELKSTTVTGSAGGNAVSVSINGDFRVQKVTLGKEAVDPDDIETLEDLLVVALNDAIGNVQELSGRKMGALTGGMKIPGLMQISSAIAGPVAALINEFSKLPTVGPKTAARLVFYLLNRPRAEAEALSEAIIALKDRVRQCSRCFSITEDDPCGICTDVRRDGSMLCVVAEAKDIYAIERTAAFRGKYHVIGGVISPMDGVGPAQLHIKELIDRIASEGFNEVVVATNPNAEGEATALYLSRLISPSGVNVTRLAYGLPIGGDLDYADEVTLAKALEGRRSLS